MIRPFWRMVSHQNLQCQKMSLGGLCWDICCGSPPTHPLHCGEACRPAGGIGKNTKAARLCQQIPEGCSGAITTLTIEFNDPCWSRLERESPGRCALATPLKRKVGSILG